MKKFRVPGLPKLSKFPKQFKEEKEPVVQPHVRSAYDNMMIELICPAIKAKQLIRFWYEDTTTDFKDWRTVEPHLIGQYKEESANIVLSAWFLPTTEQQLLDMVSKGFTSMN